MPFSHCINTFLIFTYLTPSHVHLPFSLFCCTYETGWVTMSNFLSYLNYISVVFYISQFNILVCYVEIEISTASLININLICIAHLNFSVGNIHWTEWPSRILDLRPTMMKKNLDFLIYIWCSSIHFMTLWLFLLNKRELTLKSHAFILNLLEKLIIKPSPFLR